MIKTNNETAQIRPRNLVITLTEQDLMMIQGALYTKHKNAVSDRKKDDWLTLMEKFNTAKRNAGL